MDGGNFGGADYSSGKKNFGFLYIKTKSPLLSLTSVKITGQMAFERLYQYFPFSAFPSAVAGFRQVTTFNLFSHFCYFSCTRCRDLQIQLIFSQPPVTGFGFARSEVYKPEQSM